MRVACTTWEGGGNVAVFRALKARLEARGHDVALQVGWDAPPLVDGDVLLVDHMTTNAGLEAVLASGRPSATIVHTLWSFVPKLEGTFASAGYLDLLARFRVQLVFSTRELDGVDPPDNVRHVGPVLEPEGPDAGWRPPDRSLVVVSMGTTDMGEVPVLQRILDGLSELPVDVVVTVGRHVDAGSLRVPANARVTGFIRHAALLPHADVFVGHGGHGGIMAAGAFGVPMVLVPLDRDQPHNAARAEAIEVARVVHRDAEPDAIRAAVEAVRTGERERLGAVRLANAIAGYGNAAVELVEALAR
ncbi:MAG TPA: nucleotide disphospho-sugar-binding domain-containing protein [Acidimicrobiales bacterium]|nr:nucleotide disphospho-sugar-binding domain-containing protein [Acidimicrobiales bacterium]